MRTNTVLTQDVWPELIKFLGDGYMVIWEVPDEPDIKEEPNEVVDLARTAATNYSIWAEQMIDPSQFPNNIPSDLGIGIDLGLARRLVHEDSSYDYVGPPISVAAKLEKCARPSGIAISETVHDRL